VVANLLGSCRKQAATTRVQGTRHRHAGARLYRDRAADDRHAIHPPLSSRPRYYSCSPPSFRANAGNRKSESAQHWRRSINVLARSGRSRDRPICGIVLQYAWR